MQVSVPLVGGGRNARSSKSCPCETHASALAGPRFRLKRRLQGLVPLCWSARAWRIRCIADPDTLSAAQHIQRAGGSAPGGPPPGGETPRRDGKKKKEVIDAELSSRNSSRSVLTTQPASLYRVMQAFSVLIEAGWRFAWKELLLLRRGSFVRRIEPK